MKRRAVICVLVMAMAPLVRGQAPVIGAGDMFNEVGLYYRAYANDFNAVLNTGSVAVGGILESQGADQFWDFSQGPIERVLRFDYLDPSGVVEATNFPLSRVVERKTVEGVGKVEWIFFEQVPGVGRKVYGFHSEEFSPGKPSIPFSQPVIDFPDTIAYLDTWMTSFVTESLFPLSDPEEELGDIPLQTTWNSTFTADAWGVVLVPGLGLLDALRINEEQTVDVAADFGEGWQHIETDYVRSYYWLSPGRGIVAQMASLQSSAPPPVNFDRAAAFVRMFETNKEGGSGNTDPQPVSNLRVTVSNGRVLVQWAKASNATHYRVEYSTNGWAAQNWQMLGAETTNDFLFDPDGISSEGRFYRVVSLR